MAIDGVHEEAVGAFFGGGGEGGAAFGAGGNAAGDGDGAAFAVAAVV